MDMQEEVRVTWGTGIAGYVAESGEPVNIPDAYEVNGKKAHKSPLKFIHTKKNTKALFQRASEIKHHFFSVADVIMHNVGSLCDSLSHGSDTTTKIPHLCETRVLRELEDDSFEVFFFVCEKSSRCWLLSGDENLSHYHKRARRVIEKKIGKCS